MKKKIALITGISGQDGSYLAEFLLSKGYLVHGVIRRSSTINTGRLNHIYEDPFKNKKKFFLHYGDLSDTSFIDRIIDKIEPNEIYNLAAQSHVKVSFDVPEYTTDINATGSLRILEKIKNSKLKKKIKFYQASTSEMFGNTHKKKQNENTLFNPQSPYAVSKIFSYYITKLYRESFDLFACNGILFNHESPRRGETFVTRKITLGLNDLINGNKKNIILGNLNAKRDWGHAKEYAEMQWKIMQHKNPEDFVISTGKSYSIKQFIELSFKLVGINLLWKGKGLNEKGIIKKINNKKIKNLKKGQIVIKVDKKYYRPAEVDFLKGDSSKAKKLLNWTHKISFTELVKDMIKHDVKI